MTSATQSQSNKELVLAAYAAAHHGDVDAFLDTLHDDFEESVPPALPWGGVHHGREAFRDKVLPLLAAAVDVNSIQLDAITAEGDHVVSLLTTRARSGEELRVVEHWTVRDGKLWRLIVFYHDTTPLLGAPAPAA